MSQTASALEALVALDRDHVLHPHRRRTTAEPLIVVRGEGCTLWDARGREYLDGTAGLALTQVGHGRPELAEAAAAQMGRLEYYPTFWEFANVRSIELAARLVELAPSGQRRVFFTSGGSEGVEAALRMARLYHHVRGDGERTIVLARRSAYHGVGYGSGSLTGFDDYHVGFAPMLPDVHHLTPPWACREELFGGEDPVDFCVAELEAAIDGLGAHRIAAMVAEPVMGVAGMVTPPDGYWPRVAEVLRRHGILLVADEVISAYGRTGAWFASTRYGLEPDLVVTAKGLTSGYFPLGAVLISPEVAEHLDLGPDGFPIGYTYTGHPTGCAVALANLAIIEDEGLVERAGALGASLLRALAPLAGHPVVRDVRGAGLMLAVELARDTAAGPDIAEPVARDVRDRHGIILRPHGSVISISPPLVIADADAARIADALVEAIERLDADGRVRA